MGFLNKISILLLFLGIAQLIKGLRYINFFKLNNNKNKARTITKTKQEQKKNNLNFQTYLPSGLFVIVAWLSLFLPPESIPGR